MSESSDAKLRIPWTGEFTPGQLGSDALAETLAIIRECEGDRPLIVEAIRGKWFSDAAANRIDPEERLKQQRVRSNNVLIGMQSYDLITKELIFTDVGRGLVEETDQQVRSTLFVRHLLKNRQGLELLAIVQSLRDRGTQITNDALRSELRQLGYSVSTNNGDAGKLRQWLETAGVVDSHWNVNPERLSEVAGTNLKVLSEWEALTLVQRAFLQTIRRLAETRGLRPITSPELLDFVRDEHGPIFSEGQVKRIYSVLAGDGWITHTVRPAGRGGKGGDIAATPKLIDIDFEMLLGFKPGDLPSDLRAVMATPLEKIYSDLDSDSTHIKGIALELLAVNLARDLGLDPIRLRVRGVSTGGAEVDLVAEAAHLHYSRWLFQCKNTRTVHVDVLAKEVGMATLLQAQVIVIATTGSFSGTVRTYAERLSVTSSFQVILVDGTLLDAHRASGAMALRERFHQDAQVAMQLKRPQIIEALKDLGSDES